MERIFITGYGGQLGTELFRVFNKNYKVLGTSNMPDVAGECVKHLDITDKNKVLNIVSEFKPDLVIHAAALTGVDQCEREKELAYKVNVEGTKNLVKACQKTTKFIYISSDFVFDGEAGFYKEDDKPNPVNYYGKTKLDGENVVENSRLDYLIARTSVIYSSNKNTFNFVRWVVEELRKGNEINAVTDHYTSPTLANNLAYTLLKTYERGLNGIYHIAGSERVNRYEFAIKVAKLLDLDKGLIKAVKIDDLNLIAKRPKDSSLDISKIEKAINIKLLNIKEGVSEIKGEL